MPSPRARIPAGAVRGGRVRLQRGGEHRELRALAVLAADPRLRDAQGRRRLQREHRRDGRHRALPPGRVPDPGARRAGEPRREELRDQRLPGPHGDRDRRHAQRRQRLRGRGLAAPPPGAVLGPGGRHGGREAAPGQRHRHQDRLRLPPPVGDAPLHSRDIPEDRGAGRVQEHRPPAQDRHAVGRGHHPHEHRGGGVQGRLRPGGHRVQQGPGDRGGLPQAEDQGGRRRDDHEGGILLRNPVVERDHPGQGVHQVGEDDRVPPGVADLRRVFRDEGPQRGEGPREVREGAHGALGARREHQEAPIGPRGRPRQSRWARQCSRRGARR